MPSASTLIQKAGFSDAYDARIKNQWRMTFQAADVEYDQFYKVRSIETQDTRFSYQSGFGSYTETGEGEGITYDTIYQGYDTTLTPYQYTSGFQITEIAVEDDPSGLLQGAALAAAHAEAAAETVEELAVLPLNNITSTTYASPWQSGGDGVALLATTHPILSGGVYANKPSVDVDLSVANLQASQTRLERVQNARGKVRAFKGTTLFCHPNQRWLVRQILETPNMPFGTDNTKNVIREGITPVFLSKMSDTDMWLLCAKKAATLGQRGHSATCIWRVRPTFARDNVFENGNRLYKGRFRIAFGFPDWRGIDGSTGG